MSRKPDYTIGAMNKATSAKQPKVGVAWANPDGTISVALDPFVVLSGGPDLVVTMFPAKDGSEADKKGRSPQQTLSTKFDPPHEALPEDIPF